MTHRKSKKRSTFKTALRFFLFAIVVIGAALYSTQDKESSADNQDVSSKAEGVDVPGEALRVVHVSDGDTIKLSDGRVVRYIGIDTPETKIKEGNTFHKSPQPYSLEAAEYNRKLVEGKEIRLEYDVQTKDKYGRTLAYCYVDGIFVNARMIEQGYACVFTMPPNVKYADEFVRLQRLARENQRGLWGVVSVISPREAKECVNQIRAVRGKVAHTSITKSMVYLDLGNDPVESFTVAIYRKDLAAFKNKNIHPESYYMNKTIEAVGRIRKAQRTQIIVSGPEQIDVLDK